MNSRHFIRSPRRACSICLKLWSIEECAACTPPTGYPNCRLIPRHGDRSRPHSINPSTLQLNDAWPVSQQGDRTAERSCNRLWERDNRSRKFARISVTNPWVIVTDFYCRSHRNVRIRRSALFTHPGGGQVPAG
jgi:hypothetical protein